MTADDPWAVTRPLEIRAALRGLLEDRVLVRLDIPESSAGVISTVLALDLHTGTLLLDTASDEAINVQLLRAPAVRVQASQNRVLVEFHGALKRAIHEARPAFAMPLPERVRRIQRRAFFRMGIPAGSPATCRISHPALPDGRFAFPVTDISTGGLSLNDSGQLMGDFTPGTLFEGCRLTLPDHAGLDVQLYLLRTGQWLNETGTPTPMAALRYTGLPANHQIAIQQYVDMLERAMLARRWSTG